MMGGLRMFRSDLRKHLLGRWLPVLFRSSAARAATVALVCVLLSISAHAVQTFRGSIVGTVADVNGGAIPDATVTAKNIGTGLERTTVTDSAGNYSIPELPIGTYEVTVNKNSFKAARVTDVRVEVAGERRA